MLSSNFLCAIDQQTFAGRGPGDSDPVGTGQDIKWRETFINPDLATYDENTGELTIKRDGKYRFRVEVNTSARDAFVLNVSGQLIELKNGINGQDIEREINVLANSKVFVFNAANSTEVAATSSSFDVYRILGDVVIDSEFCLNKTIPANSNIQYCPSDFDNAAVSYNSNTSVYTFKRSGLFNVFIEIETAETSKVIVNLGGNTLELTDQSRSGRLFIDFNFQTGDELFIFNKFDESTVVLDGFLSVADLATQKKRRRPHRRRCICNCNCCPVEPCEEHKHKKDKKHCHHKEHK